MGRIRRYKNGIERFLSGDKGQRFFNFAYSLGAAVVILGALFKILHLPGGSTLLCIGMGTEVAMFILTAFDRPPKEYAWEEVFPILDSHDAEQRPNFDKGIGNGVVLENVVNCKQSEYENNDNENLNLSPISSDNNSHNNTENSKVNIEYPRHSVGLPEELTLSEEDTATLRNSIARMSQASEQLSQMAELATATNDYLQQISGIAEQMNKLKETTTALNNVSEVLLNSYKSITENSENITHSSSGYVTQMEDLNRNIGGLNTIYQIQLKSVSSQLDSIDRVNRGLKDIRDMYEKSANESSRYCEESEKMARYMKQLNKVYEKMITAMTINMYNPMGGNPFSEQQNTGESFSNSQQD